MSKDIKQILDDLRDWLIEQNPENELKDIFIFLGINVDIRYFNKDGEWEVKVVDCSRCGECCSLMTGRTFPFSTPDGCKYLADSGNEKLCGLGYYRPNGCAVAELDLENCKVRWDIIK